MMADLFDYVQPAPPSVRPNYDQQTSAAAFSDAKSLTNETERRCLAALRQLGGATTDEVAERTGIDRLTVRPAFTKLKDKGQILKTSDKRENTSGKKARVWKVAD